MRLPQLTLLAIGSIYGRVRQIRPDDDIVDLTDVDVDLVEDAPTRPATPADPAGAPPR